MTVRINPLHLENLPYYTYTATIQKTSYNISIRYSTRTRSWYMDVTTRDNIPIVLGVRLVPDYPMTLYCVIPELKGMFCLLRKSEGNLDKFETEPERLADYFTLVYLYNE